MKQRKINNKAFTLIEITVSILIISVIVLTLIMVFRSNIVAWKWGTKHMGFNQKVQLIMKHIFTDIKNINPIVKKDKGGNLWFQGEKIGDLYPNIVSIFNTDGDQKNGGEEIAFYLSDFSDLTKKDHIRYFLDKKTLNREIIDYNGNKKIKVISNLATDLHFQIDEDDVSVIGVTLTISDEKDQKLKSTLDFAVRLDTDLVCVKMYNNEKK